MGKEGGLRAWREALRSKVEDAEIEVLDLDPNRIGVFDVVLFLGVLYHMRHPLLALEKVAAVTKGQVCIAKIGGVNQWNGVDRNRNGSRDYNAFAVALRPPSACSNAVFPLETSLAAVHPAQNVGCVLSFQLQPLEVGTMNDAE